MTVRMALWETFMNHPVSKVFIGYLVNHGATSGLITIIVKDKNDARFAEAEVEEVEKLIKLGSFEIVPESNIAKNGTTLHSRLVLNIKNHNKPIDYFKARLVILGHDGPEKRRGLHVATLESYLFYKIEFD